MVIGHLIIVTEDSGYNKDGNLVTEDSMNRSVYNVHQKPNTGWRQISDIMYDSTVTSV